jgi:hypothetical protein
MKNCEYWPKGGKAGPAAVGDTVLVWGDYFGAADAVEKLAYEGKKVYVVTPHRGFASWMEPVHKDVMVKRFAGGNGEALGGKTFAHPVTVIPDSSVLGIKEDGEVILIDGSFQRSALKVDNVVLADVVADEALFRKYAEAGLTVARIADVKQVRNLRGAVTDGANLGLVLDRDLGLNANQALIADLPTENRP